MNKDQNDNVQYTAADISRYLQGKMAAAEMYALEKAALEDPFLADAIEGYGESRDAGEANLKPHLDDLHHRLKKRVEEDDKKIIAINKSAWWRIAAVLVLLAGSGVLVYKLVNNSTESSKLSVARNESTTLQDTPSVKAPLQQPLTSADSGSIALSDKSPANEPQSLSSSKAEAKPTAPSLTIRPIPSNSGAVSEQESDRLLKDKFEENIAAAPSRQETFSRTAPVERSKSMHMESKETVAGNFSGKVTSKDDKPVPGASIVISGKSEGVATDSNGSFNFTLPDTVATVAVNAVGYETARTTIRSNPANSSIKLTESNNALNDVVVTGYGKRKKSSPPLKKTATVNENAEPEIGFIEYSKYIEKNKRIDSSENQLHGNVVISFYVNRNGRLSNFKVEKSVSKSYDEEAIRLLKEGPAWKTLKNKKAKADFSIDF